MLSNAFPSPSSAHNRRFQRKHAAGASLTRGAWRSLPLLAELLLFLASAAPASDGSSEADVLLQFKATISDATGALKTWDAAGPAPCHNNLTKWAGVLCGDGGDVSGLRLEDMTLSGSLSQLPLLGGLPALRTLSFMRNSFDGPMPDVGQLQSLRAVYLSRNKFTGEIPDGAFEGMSWLKKLYLADNGFSGPIPKSLAGLPKLIELRLDNNRFSGSIPNIQSQSAELVNLSNNYLEGPIPAGLRSLNAALFAGNKALCGEPLQTPCASSSAPFLSTPPPGVSHRQPFLVVAVTLLVLFGVLAVAFLLPRPRPQHDAAAADQLSQPLSTNNNNNNNKTNLDQCSEEMLERGSAGYPGTGEAATPSTKEHEHSAPKLIFVQQGGPRFELKDLLKSSAEVLGTGNFGCSYRASLTGGPSVVVKRYRDMNRVGKEDFDEHMRRLGRLSHPNLLPLLAYYYRKDEKLLVADYVPNKSLAIALHGIRSAETTELDWPSRLRIVRGIAKGLNYLYEELQMLSVPHGHLKSSNVLLSDSLEPLLTDYALAPVMNQASASQFMVAFKSPECKQRGQASKKSDIWSFGVLILEILTRKLPSAGSKQGDEGIHLAEWVNSVPEEEWSGKVFDGEMRVGRSSEGEAAKLLKIGLACCGEDEEKRYEMEEVLDEIEELRDEEE